jgi:dynein heavy chain, axonemal
MYGGRVIDDLDRRIVRVYMEEYLGEFLFDTFQPFYFYRDESIAYRIPMAQRRQDFIGNVQFGPNMLTEENNEKNPIFFIEILRNRQ